jgi:hypothetical protein
VTNVPVPPVPPPFMWACARCTELLTELGIAFTLSASEALYEGAVRCQIMLAGHLAHCHPGEIPEPHEDCQRCDYYRKWSEAQGSHDLWLEHRARDLFLPPDSSRLI